MRRGVAAVACVIAAVAAGAAVGLLNGQRAAARTASPAPVQAQLELVTTGEVPTVGNPVLNPAGVYVPPSLDVSHPLPILLALHGMGGSGANIARRLTSCADEYGWLLIAPSMAYRDYMDPEQVRLDAQENIPRLHDLMTQLHVHLGHEVVAERVLVYGFSRGGQMAHRLALFYPRDVRAVATLSAGSYTLPDPDYRPAGNRRALVFPFGVGDLELYAGEPFDAEAFARIPFWIGVGERDVVAAETSRAWDALEGSTRVDRARRFAERIHQQGGTADLHLFVDTGHQETAAMRASACDFLAQQT